MNIEDLETLTVVVEQNGFRAAAAHLNVSPGQVSKAIRRLEVHFACSIFENRRQVLTEQGNRIYEWALVTLSSKRALRSELRENDTLAFSVAGNDLILGQVLPLLIEKLSTRYRPNIRVLVGDPVAMLLRHQVDIAVVASLTKTKHKPGMIARTLTRFRFVTVASHRHDLIKNNHGVSDFPIEEVLKYGFVVPSEPVFGANEGMVAVDGWHDDEFPRRITYQTSGLHSLLCLVEQGHALAYLPEYLVDDERYCVINTIDCPYVSEQTIDLLIAEPVEYQWLQFLLSYLNVYKR